MFRMFGQTGAGSTNQRTSDSSTTFSGLRGSVCCIAKSEFYDVILLAYLFPKQKIYVKPKFLPNRA